MFPEGVVDDIVLRLDGAVRERSPTFMPSEESQAMRDEAHRRLDEMLAESLVGLPGAYGVRLCVFGSSANGFGSSKSDLDMCLNFDDSCDESGQRRMEPRDLVLKIAEILEERGMLDVDSR
jgi:DNA polymerase sigma